MSIPLSFNIDVPQLAPHVDNIKMQQLALPPNKALQQTFDPATPLADAKEASASGAAERWRQAARRHHWS